MKSYGKLIGNGDGVTFRCRGTCCVTPWVQGCLWNRNGTIVLLVLSKATVLHLTKI